MIDFNFRNDKERKRFLNEYGKWGVWFKEERTGITYYRCQLPDGQYIAVEKQPELMKKYGNVSYSIKRERYHLYNDDFDMLETRKTQILGILHELKGYCRIRIAEDLQKEAGEEK